jgi:hypothetical protein
MQIIYLKKSRYHCCSNVWNSDDPNAFLVKLIDILVLNSHRCVDLGKIFKNENYLFSFGQSMKNIIMVKVG